MAMRALSKDTKLPALWNNINGIISITLFIGSFLLPWVVLCGELKPSSAYPHMGVFGLKCFMTVIGGIGNITGAVWRLYSRLEKSYLLHFTYHRW